MWTRLDDRLLDHPKILKAAPGFGQHGCLGAIGFYTMALLWTNRHRTNGFISEVDLGHIARASGAYHWRICARSWSDAFASVGLWERVEGGFQIHDYQEFYPVADTRRGIDAKPQGTRTSPPCNTAAIEMPEVRARERSRITLICKEVVDRAEIEQRSDRDRAEIRQRSDRDRVEIEQRSGHLLSLSSTSTAGTQIDDSQRFDPADTAPRQKAKASPEGVRTRTPSDPLPIPEEEISHTYTLVGGTHASPPYSTAQVETPEARARETPKEGFDAFWEAYPKKVDRTSALATWQRLNPDAALTRQILDAIYAWATSDNWQRENGRFVPYPTKFLQQRRWEDVPPKTGPPLVSDLGRQNLANMHVALELWDARERQRRNGAH